MIAVIVSGSLLWASLTTRHSVRTGTVYFQANMLAKSYLEQIKALDYDAVVDDVIPNVVISDNATAAASDDLVGTVTIDETDNGNETKTVVVTIDWNHKMMKDNVAHQVSLSTIVTSL